MYAAVFHYYEDPITVDYIIYNINLYDIGIYKEIFKDKRYFKKCYNMEEIPTMPDTVKYQAQQDCVQYD